MKNTLLLLSLFVLSMLSCNTKSKVSKSDDKKDNTTENKESTMVSLANTTWLVVSFPTDDDPNFRPAKLYKLFFEEKDFGLKLDVNNCGGNYKMENGRITFDGLFCTEMCCDSKEATALSTELGKSARNFKLTKDELRITASQGDIVLQPYSKVKVAKELMAEKWKAINWLDLNEKTEMKFAKPYYLTFSEMGISLKLDVNTCSAKCDYLDGAVISVDANMACTRACCDSKEAEAVKKEIEGSVINYRIDKGFLYLTTTVKEIKFKAINTEE